jgi:hypothetical protein
MNLIPAPLNDHGLDGSDEDIDDLDLTDEQILIAFLRDGRDLDGTLLLMRNAPGATASHARQARTLH